MTTSGTLHDVLEARRAELATRVGEWTARSSDEHLDRCAELWPSRPLFLFDETSMTYEQMARRSRQLAATLRSLGVGPTSRVALLMANSPEFFALKFALSRLGAYTVPVNYLLGPRELEFILAHSRCHVLIADLEVPGRDLTGLLDDVLGGASGAGTRFPDLSHVVLRRDSDPDPTAARAFDFTWFADGDDELSGASLASPDHTAEIVYTSGSTGVPKGVLLTHDAMLREAYGTALSRGLSDGWTTMTALPPFHMFGYLQAILATTFVGGTVVLERRFDPERHLQLVEQHSVRDIVSVPAMTQQLVDLAPARSYDLSSLKAIFSAGNAVSSAAWQRLMTVLGVEEVTTAYGMTEACACAFMVRPDDPLEMLAESVGRPKTSGVAGIPELGGQQMKFLVVGIESGEPVEPGDEGELWFSGPTVTKGYWENPEETERALAGGWLRSGDLGRLRPDGSLILTGRVKEMYKSGGENVAPREVELTLCEHPAVQEAIVVGVPDERWGEAGCAWVVLEPGASADTAELIDHCRTRLARFKVPRSVFFITTDAIPLTGSGKVQRLTLVEMAKELRAREAAAR